MHPSPGSQTEQCPPPQARRVYKVGAAPRTGAESWAGSGEEGAGETKGLAAGLSPGLVPDTPWRGRAAPWESPHPTPPHPPPADPAPGPPGELVGTCGDSGVRTRAAATLARATRK
jgi:hypothetical protein